MGRPQAINPEQQRADDARERAELANKINAMVERIAANKKRVDDAKARMEKAVNAARAEIGTAQHELLDAIDEYHGLRKRMSALLPGVLVDGSPTNETEQHAERSHA